MTCLLCIEATQRHHGIFHRDCPGCLAREISRGPHFARVRKARRLDSDYTAVLLAAGLTHEQVKAAAAVDKATA